MNIWIIVAAAAAVITLAIALLFYKLPGALLCLVGLFGLGLCFVSIDKSTYPSSARRVSIVGHAVDWNRHHTSRRSWWTFVLMPSSQQRLLLQTSIELPQEDNGPFPVANEDTVRVTYLDENSILGDPRAIRIELLTGKSTGWSGSTDADWLGWCLGVPGGAILVVAAFSAAQVWRRKQSAEQDTDD